MKIETAGPSSVKCYVEKQCPQRLESVCESPMLWEPSGAHCRSLGFARDDKGWVGVSRGIWLVDERVRGKERWYPTQAKTGLEWGTQPSLTAKQSKKVTTSRDDKFRFDTFVGLRNTDGKRLRSTEAAQRTLPSQSPSSMEALPSPLSSRAKPRDLQCAPDGSQSFGFSHTL